MKYKVGIIGLGLQNLNDHIPALLRRNDTEISFYSDPNVDSIDRFKAQYPKIASSSSNLTNFGQIKSGDADFTIVAVPHHQYFPIVSHLVKEKIPFMKEKPLARNLAEAKAISQLPDIEKYCFVCTQRRFHSLYIKAKEMLADLGTVFLFRSTYDLDISDPSEGWRGKIDLAGGGCLLDMGYHIVDQLLWWFGNPEKKCASISSLSVESKPNYAEDTATVSFQYHNGLHGFISLSRSAGQKGELYEIHGSRGHISGNRKLLIHKNKNGDVIDQMTEENNEIMLDNQLDYFIQHLKNNLPFTENLKNNLLNMEFINSCYQSAY